jgi:hypothetical protein
MGGRQSYPLGYLPLILDVDTGIDDSLAIPYACTSPEAELVAVPREGFPVVTAGADAVS